MKKLLIALAILAVATVAPADLIVGSAGTFTYDFDSWDGTAAPTDWDVTPGNFAGTDTGTSTSGGARAYEDTVGSLGYSAGALGNSGTASYTFSLTIFNNTGMEITGLSLGFDVWQYRLANAGRASTITLDDVNSLGFNETVFTAASSGTTGAQQPPVQVGSTYSQSLTGLSIADQSSVVLSWVYDRGDGGGSSQGVAFDNVSLGVTTAIPEPATMSLLGLGALAMVLRRKIRK